MLIKDKPEDADWIMQRHKYLAGRYSKWRRFIDEVLLVFKGEWAVPAMNDPAQSMHTVERPSRPRAIVDKAASFLGVRTDMRIQVLPLNQSDREQKRADFLERVLRAWMWLIEEQSRTYIRRDVAYGTVLFGRQPVLLHYNPDDGDHFPINLEIADPRQCYTYFGRFGPSWYTRDFELPLGEVEGFFPDAPTKTWDKFMPDKNTGDRWGQLVRITEYANAEYRGYVAGGEEMVDIKKHGFGFLPLHEARLRRTSLRDEERYASNPLIGPVLDELKGEATLASRVADSVENFTDPQLLYHTTEGLRMTRSSSLEAGDWEALNTGVEPKPVLPPQNYEPLNWLKQYYDTNIHNATLPAHVFLQDIPDRASGFLMSTILGVIKDQVDDWRDSLERTYGGIMSDALKLMRDKADAQQDVPDDPEFFDPADGKFKLPGFVVEEAERRGITDWLEVGRDDIGTEHRVRVGITVDLPSDKLQSVTMATQMATLMPDGLPLFSRDTIFEVTGIVDDTSLEKERIRSDMLPVQDEMVGLTMQEMARTQWLADTEKSRRESERLATRMQKKEEKAATKKQAMGENAPVEVPAELKMNPDFWIEGAMLASQGIDPSALLTQENPGTVLANPFEQGGEVPPGAVPPDPNQVLTTDQGFPTGQEGVPSAAAPPVALGFGDRRQQDIPNLDVDRTKTKIRRGGKPPAR